MGKRTPLSMMLKTLMEDQKLTLRAIYEQSGVPRSTLSDWLAGSTPKNLRQLRAVAKVLGVTFELLACGDEEKDHEVILNSMPRSLVLDGHFKIRIERIGPEHQP